MNKKILEVLSNLSQGAIKRMTSFTIFNRGYHYFSQARTLAFAWAANNLVALVQGSITTYQVTIKATHNSLTCKCNCPAWDNYDICKHCVCVLLTASALINKEPIAGPATAMLKAQLLQTSSLEPASNNATPSTTLGTADTLSLHLKANSRVSLTHPQFQISLFQGTTKLNAYSKNIPERYAPFVYQSLEPTKQEKLLREMLDQETTPLALVIHNNQTALPVTYYPGQHAHAITQLTITSGTITIRQIAVIPGQEPISEILRVGEKIIVDLNQKRLLLLSKTAPWIWAQKIISKVSSYPQSFTNDIELPSQFKEYFGTSFPLTSQPITATPTALNEHFPLIVNPDKQQKYFIFKKNEHKIQPIPYTPQLIIEGVIDKKRKEVQLQAFLEINNELIAFNASLVNFLASQAKQLPPWVRTKGRYHKLTQALFSLIGEKNAIMVKEVIDRTTNEITSDYKSSKHIINSPIPSFLETFYKLYLTNTDEEQIIATTNAFYIIKRDYHRLWAPYRILAQLTDNNFSVKPFAFTIPLNLFYQKFSMVEQELKQHNIAFRLDKKQVQITSLDIVVDASASHGNDWFTIAPHILSQGIALTKAQREALFSDDADFTLQTDGSITILDEQTRHLLALLKKIVAPTGTQSSTALQHTITQLPRLRILDLLELRTKGAKVTLSQEDEQLLNLLTNFSGLKNIPLPKHFNGTLRDYQYRGYQWLAFLYQHRLGACLADDMGLGKTVQIIAFLGGITEGIFKQHGVNNTPHLIVVPPTLVFNWQHELQTFYPNLRVTTYTGPERNRDFAHCDVVITSYDIVRIDSDFLETITFHTIVLDEAQAIKNINSARTAAARKLKGAFTISLTGTPIENHLGEYYSIIDIALPGLLPDYKSFMKTVSENNHESLLQKIRTFVLRRTKDMILTELPPKIESNVLLEMTPKQQKLYATVATEVKHAIEQAYASKTSGQAHIIALTAILRLRQICISPLLVDHKNSSDSPKLEYLVEALLKLGEEKHAALVFSQFTSCLDLVETMLNKTHLKFYRIDGSTSMAKRKKIVESFQQEGHETAILLLSLKTGGVGLNLTRANYVFHIDPWWNPAVENQASDRSHRLGQKNSVFVTRLVMHHSIEEKMMALKKEKQELFNNVMAGVENKKATLISKKDFDLLLS